MNKAVFLDRDGTINVDVNYLSDFSQIEIFPGTIPALKKLKEAGFLNIIITNQSGVARGFFTEEHLQSINNKFLRRINQDEKLIDDILYSPYHIDGTIDKYKKHHPSRKPGTGLILEAVKKYDIDLSQSFFVGDSLVDMQCAENAGLMKILVLTGYGEKTRKECQEINLPIDFIAENISSASQFIISPIK